MNNEQKEIIEKLKKSIGKEYFIDSCYDIVDEMDMSKNPFMFVEPILEIMEENPDIEFGNPGPLVHFVERFYKHGYEELLLNSLNRNPTTHTVWMLNRIVNDPNIVDREKYIKFMKKLLNKRDIDDKVKEAIKLFLS